MVHISRSQPINLEWQEGWISTVNRDPLEVELGETRSKRIAYYPWSEITSHFASIYTIIRMLVFLNAHPTKGEPPLVVFF